MSEISIEQVAYSDGETQMKGYLASDSSRVEPGPAVLVVHEWWGCNDYAKGRAKMLAELGYTALAVDMYGGGQVADNPEQAGELMGGVMGDLDSGRARFMAALEFLNSQPMVDSGKVAAIGYCFGGAIVLHMACIGTRLAAVASFHGALGLAQKSEVKEMNTRVAAYNGQSDSFITDAEIEGFHANMKACGADYHFVQLPGQFHGFSNPEATGKGEKYGLPLKYGALADTASWAHMQMLFDETFA